VPSPDASVKPHLSSRAAQRHRHSLAPSRRPFRAARGQPYRLLAQTVSVIADLISGIRLRPESALPATDCAGFTVFPGLTATTVLSPFHRSARINDVGKYFYAAVPASSRAPSSPAQSAVPRSHAGPSRPRRGRPSAPRTGCRSLSASGSLRSPIRCPAKARHHPTLPDRLPHRRSTSFRALWHRKTHRRLPPVLHQYAIDITRCNQPPARLPAP